MRPKLRLVSNKGETVKALELASLNIFFEVEHDADTDSITVTLFETPNSKLNEVLKKPKTQDNMPKIVYQTKLTTKWPFSSISGLEYRIKSVRDKMLEKYKKEAIRRTAIDVICSVSSGMKIGIIHKDVENLINTVEKIMKSTR